LLTKIMTPPTLLRPSITSEEFIIGVQRFMNPLRPSRVLLPYLIPVSIPTI